MPSSAAFAAVDHVDRVRALALRHDAGRDFAFAVQFRDAAPLVRADLDARHVADRHRHAVRRLQHDLRDVVDALEIAAPAHRMFGLAELDHAPAHVAIAAGDRLAHVVERKPQRQQTLRIDDDVVLLDQAADARHFRDARRPSPRQSAHTNPATCASRRGSASDARSRIDKPSPRPSHPAPASASRPRADAWPPRSDIRARALRAQ